MTPLPRVMKPTMGSPGSGRQQRPNLRLRLRPRPRPIGYSGCPLHRCDGHRHFSVQRRFALRIARGRATLRRAHLHDALGDLVEVHLAVPIDTDQHRVLLERFPPLSAATASTCPLCELRRRVRIGLASRACSAAAAAAACTGGRAGTAGRRKEGFPAVGETSPISALQSAGERSRSNDELRSTSSSSSSPAYESCAVRTATASQVLLATHGSQCTSPDPSQHRHTRAAHAHSITSTTPPRRCIASVGNAGRVWAPL